MLAPHGGPHTAVTLGWYPPYAFLAALGYAVLCPNYRGSTGYGQAALGSLPGRVGGQDVADCVAAVRAAADAGGWRWWGGGGVTRGMWRGVGWKPGRKVWEVFVGLHRLTP